MLRQFQRRLANPTLVNTVAVASLKQTAILASAESTTQGAAVRRVRIRCSTVVCIGLARHSQLV